MFPLHVQDPRFHIFHQDYLPSWFIQESIRDIDHSEASSFSLYFLIFPYVSCLFFSLSNLFPPTNFLWLLDPYLCLLFFWMKTRLVALKMECCKTIRTQKKKKENRIGWLFLLFQRINWARIVFSLDYQSVIAIMYLGISHDKLLITVKGSSSGFCLLLY